MDNERMAKMLDVFKQKYIFVSINNILTDSIKRPRNSAVTASNLVKCYIQLKGELGEKLPFDSVEEFFAENGYSKGDFAAFEKRRKYETKFYIGIIY